MRPSPDTGFLKRLRDRAGLARKEILALYHAYRHPDIPLLPRIIIFITLAYALSPVDLIPDFIPVLGYLDDLIIIPALISLSIRLIPEQIMVESRARAEQGEVALKKNWLFALLFIFIWIIIAISILAAIIRLVFHFY